MPLSLLRVVVRVAGRPPAPPEAEGAEQVASTDGRTARARVGREGGKASQEPELAGGVEIAP